MATWKGLWYSLSRPTQGAPKFFQDQFFKITVQPNPSQPSRQVLAPDFIVALLREMYTDPYFGPIFKGAAATICCMVDRKDQPLAPPTARPAGGAVPDPVWFALSARPRRSSPSLHLRWPPPATFNGEKGTPTSVVENGCTLMKIQLSH